MTNQSCQAKYLGTIKIFWILVFRIMDGVKYQILFLPQICQRLLGSMIIGHPALFHDTPGCVIPHKEGSIHGPEPLLLKKEPDEPSGRLCRISLLPIAGTYGISELTGFIRSIKVQDDPDQLVRCLQADRKHDLAVHIFAEVQFLQRLRIWADKGLQDFPVMGDIAEVCFFIRRLERVDDQSFRL